MPLNIEQVLQQAVEAHKAGNLQDAAALYLTILQVQPKHPDANHNLGVLAVSINKLEFAVNLLKTAFEANQNQKQFWFSYIDALIKTNQLEIAKSVLDKGKQLGLAGKSFDSLEAQLTFFSSPSKEEMTNLLNQYKNGRYDLAESLAENLIQKYPEHQFGWKVLGALFHQTGRFQESLIANKRAVAILPTDAEAHSNLGNTLKELGMLEEAEASHRKAVAIKPDLAEAHINLGSTLQELGSLEDAEASYRKAISIKPELAEAHSNLGKILQRLGRLEEAEAIYRKAISIKSDLAEAHSNLGTTLHELGRLEEAEASHRNAIALKPDLAEAHINLGSTLQELGKLEEATGSYKIAISLKSAHEVAQYNLGIWYSEQGKYKEAAELFINLKNFKNSQSYLLKCWYFLNEQALFYELLESLTSEGLTDAIIGSFGCRAEIKFGIKKKNLFCSNPIKYVLKTDLNEKYNFEEIFIKPSNSILNNGKIKNRFQNILSNGFQTSGNLFALDDILINEIKRIIEHEVENYRLHFKASEEGLIKNWPTAYSLNGWMIRMKNGGALRPHMHEKGWISGSVYINVPQRLNKDEGSLVVCLEDELILSDTQRNKKKIINVSTGILCLFPASLLHYTIPFESEEDRIVLAFDLIPIN